MANQQPLVEQLQAFKEFLVSYATGAGVDDPEEYKAFRKGIVDNPALKAVAPEFLRSCRDVNDFWSYIKSHAPTYAERRETLREAFAPLFEVAESDLGSPADEDVAATLKRFESDSVHKLWARALERRESDPEGAITLARTLLETVCKHILDENQATYPSDSDLPKLYKETSKLLNIAPSQHSEDIFKQILGGCTAVVEGLGALRNRLSDAHGQGKRPVRPAARHAELAVNLSGTLATFIVLTYNARKSDAPADTNPPPRKHNG